ncbi:CHASE2 domain-containing protein [Dendronalium sp. ChiSLP03b]|uniref:CHASE2 domain-containing protein n=1 Tax=Dendronalium sp. ChiSLP03b TaxID=3075381 RepID=UPI002AD2CDEE|nr:CHASE2 domain-containing protein [Dendronalium sp. ChiSLP03b]MDZ8208309.1 CHASE2 domain-containing protein [Dendronalium sp. ChiSLP03b]
MTQDTEVNKTQKARFPEVEVFFYYSDNKEDEELRKKLAKQLNIGKDKISVNYYYPSEVSAGTDKKEIEKHLKTANLIIILISSDLFSLDNYNSYKELILTRHTEKQVTVIPVLLRSCTWEISEFGNVQPLPKNKKFVTEYKNTDRVLTEVAKGIIDAVKKIYGLPAEYEENSPIPPKEKPENKSQIEKIIISLKSIKWDGVRNVFLSSMSISFIVIFVRFIGGLESSELWLFDNMMKLKRPEEPDKNILIIQVTPEDIRNQGSEQRQGSLTDTTLFKILDKLLQNSEKIRPKAIGFDIHREFETKNADLSKLLKNNKNNPIFTVCYVGDETQQNSDGVKPPPEFINNRIGFSDFLPDKDGIVRRHLLIMDKNQNSSFCRSNSDNKPITKAFSLELARHFLNQSEQTLNEIPLEIGNTLFESIYRDYRGGYSMFTDLNGYQILLNYRISCINGATCSPENIAPKVTVADVLKPDFLQRYKDFVEDKIVLIGVTDPTYEAPWTTPLYSKSHRQIPGVIIQTQMISQLISAVLEKRPLLQVWSIWLEMSWIFTWSLIGGILVQTYRTDKRLTVLRVGVIVFLILPLSCYMMFIIPIVWIPCIPPILSFIGTGGMVLFLKLRFSIPQKPS